MLLLVGCCYIFRICLFIYAGSGVSHVLETQIQDNEIVCVCVRGRDEREETNKLALVKWWQQRVIKYREGFNNDLVLG